MTEIPGSWKSKALSEVCELITDGSHFSPRTQHEGIPYITVRDLDDEGIDFDNCKYISQESFDELEKNGCRPKAGDVLFSKDGTVGKVALVKGDAKFVVLSSLAILRPNRNFMTSEYLKYALMSPGLLENALGMKTGTALRRVVLRNLKTLQIPIPPIKEQLKVVELLDDHLSRLDAALLGVMQAKLKSVQFRRSILHAAFTGNIDSYGNHGVGELPIGWEMRTLSQCLEKLKSGKLAERGWSPQCLSHPADNENSWGVLKTTSVQMGEYQPQFNKELPASLAPKVGLEVNPGDFLVTTTGPRNRCGVICHVMTTRRKLIFSGKILRFRANEEIVLPNWLLFILMSPEYQTTLDGLKVGTSDSSVSIGNQQILDLVIPVPPIEVQLKIVQLLEVNLSNLEASASLIDSMEKQSSGLRRSLLQAAFSGQLTKEVASV
jgi:type I restriction enzyme S subunit